MRTVGDLSTGKPFLPQSNQAPGFLKTNTRRLRENFLGLGLQAPTAALCSFLESFNNLFIKVTYKYLCHDLLLKVAIKMIALS